MIKVVIDTNVLVSAVWNSMGLPAKIIEAVYAGTLEPIISEQILQEYATVLKYKKFSFPQNRSTMQRPSYSLQERFVSSSPTWPRTVEWHSQLA